MSDNVTKGADEKFCSSCGAIIKIAAEICPKCGVRQMATPHSKDTNVSEKSRTTTLILCIFFGVLGIHSFYTSKIGAGISQLFICCLGLITLSDGDVEFLGLTAFVLSIWLTIDFISILIGKFKDGYNNKVLNW